MLVSEAPLMPTAASTPISGYGTYGSGSNSTHSPTSFARTIAPLPANGTIVMLTTSGLTIVANSYPASATPSISAVVSAADGSVPVAPGELVSIFGQNLSGINLGASSLPLATSIGDACLAVNGTPIPLLSLSSKSQTSTPSFRSIRSETPA